VTLAGRSANLAGIERGIGLYAATLPLCIDTLDQQSTKLWLQGIAKTLQSHADHDALAVADLQKLVNREINEPLFSTVVALAGHDSDLCFGTTQHDGIQMDSVEYQIRSHFDVSLLIKAGERISVHFISQTDKFDQAVNDSILERYKLALGLLIEPSCASVPLLRERWNHIELDNRDYSEAIALPPQRRIDDWILDVAQQNPISKFNIRQSRSPNWYLCRKRCRRDCCDVGCINVRSLLSSNRYSTAS